MRKIDETELYEIISNHKLWLMDESNGIRADLRHVDLKYANLYGDDLRYADLSGADLYGAYIEGANLGHANLYGANLYGANLRNTNLSDANLSGANLGCADLSDADLNGANLRDANLGCADLGYADLSDADLSCASLWSTDLSCVKNIFFPMACPEKGSFIAFKKAGFYIIELFIPTNAKRCSATSRKCRCNKAKVISITTLSGDATTITEVHSTYDPNFIYKLGEYVEVKNFDDNRWNECSTGIHFFITRQEAVNY